MNLKEAVKIARWQKAVSPELRGKQTQALIALLDFAERQHALIADAGIQLADEKVAELVAIYKEARAAGLGKGE